MARFVFISDTHIGAMPLGYQQQPGYPQRLPEIIAALDGWIVDQGDIDFVIHGGDMINAASPEFISEARGLFRLSVPVYLCMGNHDMMGPDALEMWLTHAPDLLYGGAPDGRIVDECSVVHILPTHWDRTDYYWAEGEDPHLLPGQLERLRAGLAEFHRRTHILVTHSQVLPLPTAQTGFDEPFRGPTESFAGSIGEIAGRYPQLRCILSGHTHLNMHVVHRGVHYVTVSGLPESPFEFKVVDATAESLTMSTIGLSEAVEFTPRYDFEKTFVQGRPTDRQFVDHLGRADAPGEPT